MTADDQSADPGPAQQKGDAPHKGRSGRRRRGSHATVKSIRDTARGADSILEAARAADAFGQSIRAADAIGLGAGAADIIRQSAAADAIGLGSMAAEKLRLSAGAADAIGLGSMAAEKLRLSAGVADAIGLGSIAADKVRELANLPGAEMVRRLEKRDGILRAAAEGPAKQLQSIIGDSERWTSQLRAMEEPLRTLRAMPNPQVEATYAIQSQLPELVEISAQTSAQIGQLATIAKEGLQESQELRTTMVVFAQESKRSGDRLTFLTWAVVGLTAVVVVLTGVLTWLGLGEPLGWWPW